ncbi:histidine phosphatase family protein [Paenibacillus alvei]|uniref:Histidine phosphatase family protein n=1 Tax=Paenibacillus alvei TaxID=44250 RepID=A0AAP6ZYV2_PAEAL|nr:histidine phosphatase family protein [Paenibacillus alvei]MBG9733310.1 phosphoglycerate mutase [Paenibacillus alvei]MBG9745131.1 phosphoglycerate mutase [Paenibacillus alvei]MCY9580740.1 histidine phosphatase family protein [Paenibacillus alvei]MCY9585223.1 histidine phosphatase family protein [Paenibacillus alvei]NOJ72221.1 histidine phosphatase family protein [Paenibacillus alvei]
MKIGLVRHFKVQYEPETKWMTSAEFNHWVEQYDQAEVILGDPPADNIAWSICVSSDLPRAVTTAEYIHQGGIMATNRLREIGMKAVFHTKMKLPHSFWMILARLAWSFSHPSQEEKKQDTLRRIREVTDWIEENCQSNVLIVCHGALMKYLHKELIRRGYKGQAFLKPQNGKLYLYETAASQAALPVK